MKKLYKSDGVKTFWNNCIRKFNELDAMRKTLVYALVAILALTVLYLVPAEVKESKGQLLANATARWQAYKASIGTKQKEKVVPVPTVYDLLCDVMYQYNYANITLANITCYKSSDHFACVCLEAV